MLGLHGRVTVLGRSPRRRAEPGRPGGAGRDRHARSGTGEPGSASSNARTPRGIETRHGRGNAWTEYNVPASPHFVLTDGSGAIRGRGSAIGWAQLLELVPRGSSKEDTDHEKRNSPLGADDGAARTPRRTDPRGRRHRAGTSEPVRRRCGRFGSERLHDRFGGPMITAPVLVGIALVAVAGAVKSTWSP